MTESDVFPIAVRVRRLRERQVLTQRELAERAGIAVDTVNRIEQWPIDNGRPRVSTIRKLARALGVKPADLVA